MLIEILLIFGNALCTIYLLTAMFTGGFKANDYMFVIPLTVLFGLNTLYISGIIKDTYIKRKRLEEEIKIQEAKNKLKDLKDKK